MATHTTTTRVDSQGRLNHSSEAQQKTFAGFCQCLPGDMGQPLSRTLAIVATNDDLNLYWVEGDDSATIGGNISNLKAFIRQEPGVSGAVLGDTGFVSVFTCPAPQLVG